MGQKRLPVRKIREILRHDCFPFFLAFAINHLSQAPARFLRALEFPAIRMLGNRYLMAGFTVNSFGSWPFR